MGFVGFLSVPFKSIDFLIENVNISPTRMSPVNKSVQHQRETKFTKQTQNVRPQEHKN